MNYKEGKSKNKKDRKKEKFEWKMNVEVVTKSLPAAWKSGERRLMTVPSGKFARSDEIVSPTARPIPHNKYNFPAASAALYVQFRATRKSGRAIVHSTTFTIASSREIEPEFDSSIRVRAQLYQKSSTH